jgi:hypothetical protein
MKDGKPRLESSSYVYHTDQTGIYLTKEMKRIGEKAWLYPWLDKEYGDGFYKFIRWYLLLIRTAKTPNIFIQLLKKKTKMSTGSMNVCLTAILTCRMKKQTAHREAVVELSNL